MLVFSCISNVLAIYFSVRTTSNFFTNLKQIFYALYNLSVVVTDLQKNNSKLTSKNLYVPNSCFQISLRVFQRWAKINNG
jgi:hypothetical protein